MYNEIFEVGQYVSVFSDIFENKQFRKIVHLTRAVDNPFKHSRITHDDYFLQLWNYTDLEDMNNSSYFCLYKIEPLTTTHT